MFSRLLTLILWMAVIAAVLLALRQNRIEMTQRILALHLQVQQSRHALWDQQIAIAEHVRPAELLASIGRAQLNLEPIAPVASAMSRDGSDTLAALPREPAGVP